MALRVLLADESTTIKKVMQLALQDFAVEVKAVHAGVDVVEVARSFQPDLIFADVLLQKKNGYDVCGDLKADSELKVIPVVLMWSSFMDLDEKQAAQCGAESRLEKPFDVESLRQLVLDLVPKTRSQRLAHFLKFPDSFAQPLKTEEQAKKENAPTRPATQAAPIQMPPPAQAARPEPKPAAERPTTRTNAAIPMPPPQAPAAKSTWNMESFDDIAKFETDDGSAAGPSVVSRLEVEETGVFDLAQDGPADFSSNHNESKDDLSGDSSGDSSHDFSGESADEPGDEVFTEFKLTNLSAQRSNSLKQSTSAGNPSQVSTASAPQASAPADDDDPWSHQDLSAFKIELPPVSVEGEDLALTFDLSQRDPEGTDFLLNRQLSQQAERPTQASAPVEPAQDHGLDGLEEIEMPEHYKAFETSEEAPMDSGPELQTESYADMQVETVPHDYNPAAEIPEAPQFQLSDFSQPAPAQPSRAAETAQVSSKIPQLNADQLEEIIRSQSREIIESVVRRIVPDIASDIIKQELQRLLEDTAVREATGRETRR